MYLYLATLMISLIGDLPSAASPISWDMEELYRVPAMTPTSEFAVPGMMSFFYDGISYEGRPTRVYAYYKAPAGTPPEGGWPAVVCVHGGGGTAFYEWVQKWVDHGYAAIAMDLEGHLPDLKKMDRDRLGFDGSGPSRDSVFGDFKKPTKELWFYQAMAQVIRAHSLVRSFPEVNPEKTGITGISWGGMLTCAVVQMDPRFKFAVPVYGCGFLVGSDSFMGEKIFDPVHQQVFNAFLGASARFDAVKIPVFFINGTNDKFFPMPSTVQTAEAVKGSVDFLFPVRMAHGHKAGWTPEEIYVFADSVVRETSPLSQVGSVSRQGKRASVPFTCGVGIVNAELCFTEDSGQWDLRLWKTSPATIGDNCVGAELSEQTTAFFFTLIDDRGLRVSTNCQICEEGINK